MPCSREGGKVGESHRFSMGYRQKNILTSENQENSLKFLEIPKKSMNISS